MNRPLRFRVFCVLCTAIFCAATLCSPASAGKFNKVLSVGDAAPEWKELEGIDAKPHSLADLKDSKAVVVVFTCVHCPVARGYEGRLIEFAKEYTERGVAVVAISVSLRPEDGLEKMQARAKASGYNFPYLHAPTQDIARRYGATNTPQFFLLGESDESGQRKIAYMGAFDNNNDPVLVENQFLADAVDALLARKKPPRTETRPRGCEIEYK
jgi:peroxiredoxin